MVGLDESIADGERVTEPIRVRLATTEDVPALCALGREIEADHAAAWPRIFSTGVDQAGYWSGWLTRPDHCAWVAVRQGAVVGMLVAHVSDDTSPILVPQRVCRLDTIVVTAGARRTGVGRALVRAVEHWGRENGATDLRLMVFDFNRGAIATYESLGLVTRARVMGKFLDADSTAP